MVKDTLNSIFDNLKERTTNPFLGTLAVVWTIKNWKLVYSLLYFDGNFKLKDRLDYITEYFSQHSFVSNMLGVISITLGLLVVTYFLLTLSRLLTDSYERIVIPWISKVTDKSTIVLKSDYSKILEEVKRLELRLEEERQARFTVQTERDSAEQKLIERRTTLTAKPINSTDKDSELTEKIETELDDKNDDKILSPVKHSYFNPSDSGRINFDYSNNNGIYRIGKDEYTFDLKWSKAGHTSIYALNDSPNIKTVALAKGVVEINKIADASRYDDSSRYRKPMINQILIVKNINNYYAAVKILDLKDDSRESDNDEITFEYVIQTDKTADFTTLI